MRLVLILPLGYPISVNIPHAPMAKEHGSADAIIQLIPKVSGTCIKLLSNLTGTNT
jgi:hypothetical protein